MNRTLFGIAATTFAIGGALCCADNSAADIMGVTQNDSTAAQIASAKVTLAASTLKAGQTTQATVLFLDSQNQPVVLPVTWSTSNASVATVSGSGVVTAIAPGVVAISASWGTDSAGDTLTVASTLVPVASVSVSLAASSLNVGATTQATATLRDASNNVLTGRAVSWSSSNTGVASVNSTSGLVTAAGAGTATITATSESKSGNATVTATAASSPPPPSGSSNEPSGMALLKQRAFNSLQEDASWDTDNSLSIVQDANAPKSPSNVIRGTYRSGESGGSSPGHAGTIHSGSRVLYISYWGKLSANFFGHLTGVNKQLYEWANGVSPFYFELGGVGTGTLTPQVVLQGTPTDGIYRPNLVPSSHVTRGQWFHVEIVLTGNTSGSKNGSVDWWLDGVHVGSLSSLQFTSSTTSWNTFEFRPVWGGVGDIVPSTMTLDWDDLYLSGKN
jgi:hypothetical protein